MGTGEQVVQHVVEHARCPECGAGYRIEDVHLLGHTGAQVWDLAAVCPECYALALARAVVVPPRARGEGDLDPDLDLDAGIGFDRGAAPGDDALPQGSGRDLDERSPAERIRLERLGPVERGDVRDAAAFLEGFDGDVDAWLARRSDPDAAHGSDASEGPSADAGA